MALSYSESAALMNDGPFRERVKVACLKYAAYIENEPASATAHNTRYRWAQNTMQAPDNAAAVVTPTAVMADQVQVDGAAITDANLQTAVEVSVNKLL